MNLTTPQNAGTDTNAPATDRASGCCVERLVGRELEIQRVATAIAKTEAAQIRAQETLERLYEKKCRQTAELRFQKMLLSMDKQRAALAANTKVSDSRE